MTEGRPTVVVEAGQLSHIKLHSPTRAKCSVCGATREAAERILQRHEGGR
jgi:hypothetical protein